MLTAKVSVKALVNRINELKDEQCEYASAISNLVDDCSNDNAAVRALRSCKSIVDNKITKLESLRVTIDNADKEALEGILGVVYVGTQEVTF